MLSAEDQAAEGSPAHASLSADELRALLAEQDQLLAAKDRLVREKDKLVSEKEKRIALLEAELRLARQQHFGAKSEKVSFQGDFFDEAELEQALLDVEAATAPAQSGAQARRRLLGQAPPSTRRTDPQR